MKEPIASTFSYDPTFAIRLPYQNTFVLNRRNDENRWQSFLRQNRWQNFSGRLHRFPMVRENHVRPPTPWEGSPRAWARTRAMTSVLEYCLNARIASGMIMDDDAILTPDGIESLERFSKELPVDWQLLILAGEHVDLKFGVPVEVSLHVYRPFAIDGASAILWRGFPMLRKLYDFYLRSSASPIMVRDFCRGRRMQSRCIYVPDRWVFTRTESQSTQRQNAPVIRTTRGAAAIRHLPIKPNQVAVLAAYRGGSSCVAGVLHHLGVSMGENLAPADKINPRGYFECNELLSLCKRIVDHPSLQRRIPDQQIIGLLHQWAVRRAVASDEAMLIGAKHPALSTLGHEVTQAWPGSRFVVVDRPREAIISSIVRTSWGWNRHEAVLNVDRLMNHRERFLKTCDPARFLRVDYETVCIAPVPQIQRIADWLNLEVGQKNIDAAVAHVLKR